MLSSAGVVADCSLHRTSAIQDLQVLAGTQQLSAPLELWQIVPYTTDLPSRTCRSWKELSSAGPVADCSLPCTSAIQDLQVLEGAQQCSAALELWQIAPFTAQLPSSTCRSWQELNSAQRCWSCGRLFLTPQICHPGPAGPGRSSAALALWQIVPYPAHLPSRTCRSWKELSSARQHWSCGRLLLTPQICHPGPAGPGRSSAALELWQIVPYTAALPSRTCRS